MQQLDNITLGVSALVYLFYILFIFVTRTWVFKIACFIHITASYHKSYLGLSAISMPWLLINVSIINLFHQLSLTINVCRYSLLSTSTPASTSPNSYWLKLPMKIALRAGK